MIGQAKVIVRAHVEHAPAASDLDLRILRAGDDALGFVKTLRFDFVECLGKLLFKFGEHVFTFTNANAVCHSERSRGRNATRPREAGLSIPWHYG